MYLEKRGTDKGTVATLDAPFEAYLVSAMPQLNFVEEVCFRFTVKNNYYYAKFGLMKCQMNFNNAPFLLPESN